MATNPLRIPITAIDRTGAAFTSVSKGLGNIGAKVLKLTAAFGTLGVAAGVTVVRSQMASIDALGKTADKIGVTTEALGRLRYAADLTGVSTSTMDMALQRFTRRTAEAAKGTGEAKGALLELGLNANELVALPLDESMAKVADAMQGVETQSDRVRLAMKLFDSEGVSLLQTLQGGSVALNDMSREADKLGISLSRADVRMIEDANDEITRAMGVMNGIAQQITIELAPLIGAAADKFRQASLDSADFGTTGQRVVRAIATAVAGMIDTIHNIKIVLKGVEIAWEGFKAVGLAALAILVSPIQAVIDGLNVMREALGKPLIPPLVVDNVMQAADNIAALRAELEAMRSAPSALDGVTNALDEITVAARRSAEATTQNTNANDDNEEAVKRLTFADKIQMEGAQKKAEFVKMSLGEQTDTVLSNMSTMFSASKKFNIASAIMDTYKAATLALASYPPPLNAILASGVVAAGMQNVATIRAQSYEGGGYTGRGARSGGVDGRGGMMAVVHPDESVIDHKKNQGAGVVVNNYIEAPGADQNSVQQIEQLMAAVKVEMQAQIIDLQSRGRMA